MALFPSVTSKRIRRLSLRTTLPSFTKPPMRTRAPGATCFSTRSVGELKNTIESLSALSTRATAIASTPRAEPIRARRRCLRVIVCPCGLGWSAFETQPFDEFIDAAKFLRCTAKRPARLADGGARLFALAQYHIGAHQPQPSLDVGAVAT